MGEKMDSIKLLELQAMQKQLDNAIVNKRERNESDIITSAIAEIIEWNETTKFSHKTWKTKIYTRAEQLEEFVDILFFILQLNNHYKLIPTNKITILMQLEKLKSYNFLISNIIDAKQEKMSRIFGCYFKVAELFGYSSNEIYEEYKRKHRINLNRINNEWN